MGNPLLKKGDLSLLTNNLRIYLIGLFFLVTHILTGQTSASKNRISNEVESVWKGFQRLDFSVGERDARLILPPEPLLGNPWIWRARFPDWHTDADSILVSEGYHLVYIDTDNLYGSPQAMEIWNDFYQFITDTWNLHEKVTLMGVSRGGLFIYNWARQNPRKVASIYAEAPVCDFKSWPGGFGEGLGNEENWAKLKQVYGFGTDEQAMAYRYNPFENLDDLARQKVPILHMVSLVDNVVPYDENTKLLVENYIALGGPATIIPCDASPDVSEGHHFDIQTPRLVADFIKYHYQKHLPIPSAPYHHTRNHLSNSRITFEGKKKGRVAFLGGSITYNPGWRDSVMVYLTRRFPETAFEFIAAGIPSMGTTPAAFRLTRDVLSRGKIDLLFEEAAVNDATNGRTKEEQIRAMEGIVRHCRNANPDMDLVIMHFVDPDKMRQYNQGKVPQVITNHEKVADHYGISTINLAQEVTDRINHGEFTWEDDFRDLHPSPFGQGIYARSIIDFLSTDFAIQNQSEIIPHPLPTKLDPSCYDHGILVDIGHANYEKGWQVDTNWIPADDVGTRNNYTHVPMLISNTPGEVLEFSFTGNTVGVAVAAGPDAGIIEYRIDGGAWKEQNLFTKWSKQLHLPWYYTLASGLRNQKHTLEIRLADHPTGKACRIRYFYVNE